MLTFFLVLNMSAIINVADPSVQLAPDRLSRQGLSNQAFAFKQEVYRLHVGRSSRRNRKRIYDLPEKELAVVLGTEFKMQRDAAAAAGRLLAAARRDLERDLKSTAGDAESLDRKERARRVKGLGITSAYRPASRQFAIWDRNFIRYYDATATTRKAVDGGEHSQKAAELLRDYVGVRVAAPGFSNHQSGIAVDFALMLHPSPGSESRLGAAMAQVDPWKESWFWRWLGKRAAEFDFVPYEPEPWHWEYKPKKPLKNQAAANKN